MPWDIEPDHPECDDENSFAVVKRDTGEVEGCHPSRDDAEAQLAALNAAEADDNAKMSDPQVNPEAMPAGGAITLEAIQQHRAKQEREDATFDIVDDFLMALDNIYRREDVDTIPALSNLFAETGNAIAGVDSAKGLAGVFLRSFKQSESLDDRLQMVRRAFRRQFDPPMGFDFWIPEVFDDSVIVDADGVYYRVMYTESDGDIEFVPRTDWEEVEEQSEWVTVKVGRRNAAEDLARIQKIHDAAYELGAECVAKGTHDDESMKVVAPHKHLYGQPSTTVKSLGDNRVGGYLITWGDSSRRDLEGEYFTPNTKEIDAIYKALGKLPALYHHASDETIKTNVVGLIDTMEFDDIGVWVEAQLDKANQYQEAVQQLVEKGALHWSSGTLPMAREVARDGNIKRWPAVEGSMTPTPAQPFGNDIQTLHKAYDESGIDIDEAFKACGLTDSCDDGEGGEDPRRQRIEVKRKRLQLAKHIT